jgi:hypothetical protein
LYQDTGSTQSFNARLARSGTLDNWGGTVTSIAASANISVPSGVVTPFSATFTLGATDATNGLMVEMFTSNTVTCTNKNFALSDWQLELGSVKTPYEMRPIGVELALCQRYYQATNNFSGYGTGGTTINGMVIAVFPMRTAFSVGLTGVFSLSDYYSADQTQATAGIGLFNGTPTGAAITLTGFSGGVTAGRVYLARMANSNLITLSAEL